MKRDSSERLRQWCGIKDVAGSGDPAEVRWRKNKTKEANWQEAIGSLGVSLRTEKP